MRLRDGIKKYFKKDVDVYTSTKSPNEFGEMIETWSKSRTINGLIRPRTGSEPFVAGAEHQISTHRLYTDDFNINENNRITYQNQNFDVIFVSNVMNFTEFAQIDLQLVK